MATLAERIASNQAAIDAVESGAQGVMSEGESLTRPTLRDLYAERKDLLIEKGWTEKGRRSVYEC